VRAALATIDAMLGAISDAAGLTAGLTLGRRHLVCSRARWRRASAAASTDAVVLKVLGARRRDVVAAFLIEFGLIGLAAAVVASAIGTACAYVLWGIYLRVPFVFLPQTVLAVAIFAVLLVGGPRPRRTPGARSWQKSAPVLRNA